MIGSLVVRFATSGAWRAATTSVARVCLDQIRPLTALPKVPAHMAGSQVSSVFRRSECAPNLKPSSSGVQYCMSQQQTAFPRASGFSLQSQPAGSSVNSMTCYPTRCLLLPCLPVMSLTLQPSTKLNLAPSTTAIPLGSAIWSTHKQQASARVQAHHWMHNAGDTQKAGACQELLSGAGDSQELLSGTCNVPLCGHYPSCTDLLVLPKDGSLHCAERNFATMLQDWLGKVALPICDVFKQCWQPSIHSIELVLLET